MHLTGSGEAGHAMHHIDAVRESCASVTSISVLMTAWTRECQVGHGDSSL